MKQQPYTEVQTLNRLSYFAINRVTADADPVANACFWLTRGPDELQVRSRWSVILATFAVMFRSAYQKGMRIPPPSLIKSVEMRSFQPALADVLLMWEEAKRQVLGLPTSTTRRLVGGSLGEPVETDDPAVIGPPESNSPAQPPQEPPSLRTSVPSFFREITVRPAKLTREESAAPSLIDATALEAAERETTDADALLAEMFGAVATQSNLNGPKLS